MDRCGAFLEKAGLSMISSSLRQRCCNDAETLLNVAAASPRRYRCWFARLSPSLKSAGLRLAVSNSQPASHAAQDGRQPPSAPSSISWPELTVRNVSFLFLRFVYFYFCYYEAEKISRRKVAARFFLFSLGGLFAEKVLLGGTDSGVVFPAALRGSSQ